jgi:hypothetical protein
LKSIHLVTAVLVALSPIAQSMAYAQPVAGHCPPGLEKKDPSCIPPGQVGKSYRIGERYDDDGDWHDEYGRRYNLPRLPEGESYYRIGDNFLRVDDETRLVLELIDLLAGGSN